MPTSNTADHIEALNERTFEHLYPELTEEQRCDAALARDLLRMDDGPDPWPAAHYFIMRVLARHDLLQHPQDIYETEDEYAAAREDLGPDASPDTVRWLVEQRANIACAEHTREECTWHPVASPLASH